MNLDFLFGWWTGAFFWFAVRPVLRHWREKRNPALREKRLQREFSYASYELARFRAETSGEGR